MLNKTLENNSIILKPFELKDAEAHLAGEDLEQIISTKLDTEKSEKLQRKWLNI